MRKSTDLGRGQAFVSNIIESRNADLVAERSRDDVYKQAGGELLRWMISGLLICVMFGLRWGHGYMTAIETRPQIVKTNTRYVRQVIILKPTGERILPKTGADGSIIYSPK